MSNKRMCFVFGSNSAGIHGAGAAQYAVRNHGAVFGMGYGHYGNSFAIPTKDMNVHTLDIDSIRNYVTGFLQYARCRRKTLFQVTRLGCGLAGYEDKDIAPLFKNAPANCLFDEAWKPFLGDSFKYWGQG